MVSNQELLWIEIYLNNNQQQTVVSISNMTTWYGKTASKQIEALLENKPKLHELFAFSEFNQELKAYHSKLLDYISTNPSIIHEAITYLTVPPSINDSNQRKFKWPLQTIEMIETQTTCIFNAFFKETEKKDVFNFDLLFSILETESILPLLAGYFFRTNLCLLNNRYKETLDRVYSNGKIFYSLIEHTEQMAISNTIQHFLNLDINKSSASSPERLGLKLDTIRAIIKKISYHSKLRSQQSSCIIENLCSVLIQTIDKYYLILDGKQMIEVLAEQGTIDVMISLIKEKHQSSFSAFAFFISLINYYSFSSFNSDQIANPDSLKKNAERLDSQPMIIELIRLFPYALDQVNNAPTFTLYYYKLLEVFCHCISISSQKILAKICEIKFFSHLINLLFKHEKNNILHMLIEKSFYHIFISQRKIYEEYKRHLFVDLNIIDLTVNRILKLFPEDKFFQNIKQKTYFGHFMRILKIYSGIQPTDDKIIHVIKTNSASWSKISELLIKPYEAICFQELGSYENVPNPTNQEFTLKKLNNINSEIIKNNAAILEIQREEQEQEKLILATHSYSEKQREETLHDDLRPQNTSPEAIRRKSKEKQKEIQQNQFPPMIGQKDLKKTESFKDFMSKKKVEAENQIKLKRSLSKDAQLKNTSRGKMTSPSPSKKNSWKDEKTEDKSKIKSIDHSADEKDKAMSTGPRIPTNKKNASTNNISERENRFTSEQKRVNKIISIEELKKYKVYRIEGPKEKRYRKTNEGDKTLLEFLGIPM